ncbi:MAG: conjugative transposon protein TraN [Chitinophagaceae bacterium]
MKQLVCVICGFFFLLSSFGQVQPNVFSLPIATDKTTSLIFPFAIRYVDRGTKDVLVQQVKEADNLLLVKAAQADFPATNLSVVTADGRLYSFEVKYMSQVPWTVLELPLPRYDSSSIYFPTEIMNIKDLESYTKGILDNRKFIFGVNDKAWDVFADVSGLYIKDKVLFFQLRLANGTPLSYDVDYIRFYLRDKKKGKRKASQEVELIPLYKTGNIQTIPAFQRSVAGFALEKFTVPDAKYFYIEIAEKNGGRHLRLKVTNKKLLRSKILPSYR